MTIEELLADIKTTLADREKQASDEDIIRVLKEQRGGSRFIGKDGDEELAKLLADGASVPAERTTPGAATDDKGGSLAATLKALAVATPSAGGYLVPPQIADEVLKIVRTRSAIMAMGPKVTPVAKELIVNAFSSGVAGGYVAENARLPVSEPTFSQQVILRPKELGVLVPVSNKMLRSAQENPDVEQLLREEMAESLATRADLAFIQGSAADEPLGIVNQAGLTPGPNLGANGATPNFDQLKAIPAALRAVNAPFRKPGWVFHPRLLSTLETFKDTTGRYLIDSGLLTFDATGAGGTLLGFPFRTSSQIPTNITQGTSGDTTYVIFSSDWNSCWIGEDVALEIEVSNSASYSTDGGTTHISAWQSRQTVFRAISSHDLGLVRPQFFVVTGGVRP